MAPRLRKTTAQPECSAPGFPGWTCPPHRRGPAAQSRLWHRPAPVPQQYHRDAQSASAWTDHTPLVAPRFDAGVHGMQAATRIARRIQWAHRRMVVATADACINLPRPGKSLLAYKFERNSRTVRASLRGLRIFILNSSARLVVLGPARVRPVCPKTRLSNTSRQELYGACRRIGLGVSWAITCTRPVAVSLHTQAPIIEALRGRPRWRLQGMPEGHTDRPEMTLADTPMGADGDPGFPQGFDRAGGRNLHALSRAIEARAPKPSGFPQRAPVFFRLLPPARPVAQPADAPLPGLLDSCVFPYCHLC